MRAELERTERLYRDGMNGIAFLPEECRFGVLLAAVLYADHHRLIREQGYDVLANRPSLSARRRIALFARTWWHWRRTDDPRATFDAVDVLLSDDGTIDDCDYRTAAGIGATIRDTLPGTGILGGLRSLIP